MSTAAGVDHVRLSYHYLDTGDLDGYASLLHPDMQLKRSDSPPGHGREHTVRLLNAVHALKGKHHIHKLVADKDTVVVVGRYTPPPNAERRAPSEFADVVTLSEEGLLLCSRRFYYVDPPSL